MSNETSKIELIFDYEAKKKISDEFDDGLDELQEILSNYLSDQFGDSAVIEGKMDDGGRGASYEIIKVVAEKAAEVANAVASWFSNKGFQFYISEKRNADGSLERILKVSVGSIQ